MSKFQSSVNIQLDVYERVEKAYKNYKKSPKERITAPYLETRLETLECYWNSFKSQHQQLITYVTEEERQDNPYFTNDMYDSLEDLYTIYKSEIRTTLMGILPQKCDKQQNVSNQTNHSTEVQLPRIAIPQFSGDYTQWQSFHDLFLALIHNNKSLENVQKLQYLKSSMRGEAEVLLRQFSITGDNYIEAWAILRKRYDNKRYIANTIFKRFFGQKSLTQDTAHSLKQLLDTSVECMNGLKNLGLPVDKWDAIIIYIVSSKLDAHTRKQWEESTSKEDEEFPTFEKLKGFLETRFRTLEIVEPEKKTYKPVGQQIFHTTTTANEMECSFCKEKHYLYSCKEFAKESVAERRMFAQKNRLCFNCLVPNHTSFNCRHKTYCRICKRRHHSLLHEDKIQTGDETLKNETTNTQLQKEIKVISHIAREEQPSRQVVLATALVDVQSRSGETHVLRALIDQGSEASFVTSRVVELLGLNKSKVNGVVSGVGDSNDLEVRHMTYLKIGSRCEPNYTVVVKALLLKSLTRKLPTKEVTGFIWPELTGMKLADPMYDTPGKIDILLGSDTFCKIICSGLVRGPQNLIAQSTHLGWIVSGEIATTATKSFIVKSLHVTQLSEEDNQLLKKFWEVEENVYTKKRILSQEEQECERIYKETTKRDETGRYIVHLPLKEDIGTTVKTIGDTKQQAIKRLLLLENKFKRNEKLKVEYTKVMKEYIDLGHMKRCENEDIGNCTYLAHHAVIREDKETSKVRVVFDASAKGSNGTSLNEAMMVGPTIQPDLRSIIIRWRQHKICVVGDIVKMYRQIKMIEEHSNLQRIVWRDDPEKEITSYQLLTVTFGTSAAPFLAVRTLYQLADDETHVSPKANIIKDSFYMDDFMTGGEELSEIKKTCTDINKILNKGGFEMQKWSSNSEELLEYLQQVSQNTLKEDNFEIKLDKVIKILGLKWNRTEDTFIITVNLPELTYKITKRRILSDIAKLFDPFGWLAPVIITAKIFIQKLWLCNLDWDDEVPSAIAEEWITYRKELKHLNIIEIPRWLKTTTRCNIIELHGFSDASTLAYAAVVYVRVLDENGDIFITVVASKSRVAPLKQLSIPKLELCGAVLLAKLIEDVAGLLKISMENIYAYTDSMVVLSWLQSQPSKWQVFVGNRVSKIIKRIDNTHWRHVNSNDNPADLATRGVKPSDLQDSHIWWTGPDWLKGDVTHLEKKLIPQTDLERKKTFYTDVKEQEMPIWERFSSLNRMKRVIAYCRRYLGFSKETDSCIQPQELEEVMICCIKFYQNLRYSEEIHDLIKNGKVKKGSSLITLAPYLDKNGVLRVGGRLAKSNLSEDSKHQIIIPGKEHITWLIIIEAHNKTLHGGITQMMTYIRSRYWICRLKLALRDYVRKCNVCIRNEARITQQLMGQLPIARVTPQRAFYNSGVDFAGPILMRTSKGRSYKCIKGYISVFICMSTKAIHIEAVSDLTSQAFLAAFRRFVSRRGHCVHLWSDNATNFVGANREMKLMLQESIRNVSKEVGDTLANDGTTWHFIPPKAPNFGGLWEAGVRSVKKHLVKMIGSTKLTFEEITTLLTQIEACLNSRPLCQLDDTSDTLTPLTPGHFLIGEPLISIPDVNKEYTNINLLTRWQLIQNRLQYFWNRWKQEYLNTLQQRYKWQEVISPPNIGDIVIVKENELPPTKWLLGKIVALHPGPDNLVRVASVQTERNIFKRPLSKLIPLTKSSQ